MTMSGLPSPFMSATAQPDADIPSVYRTRADPFLSASLGRCISRQLSLSFRIVFLRAHQHTKAPHIAGLLRVGN